MKNRKVRAVLIVILIVLLPLCAFYYAVQRPAVQTFLARQVTAILSATLDTEVSISKVKIKFFSRAELVDFYMADHRKDTLIFSHRLEVNFSAFNLFRNRILVKDMHLDGGHLYLRKDAATGRLNIEDVFGAFQSKKENKDTTTGEFKWDLDLEELKLSHVHFKYRDEATGTGASVLLGHAELLVRHFNLKKNLIDIRSLHFDRAEVALVQSTKKEEEPEPDKDIHFLKGGLKIRFGELLVTRSSFRVDVAGHDSVLKKGIDFRHLNVSDIYLLAKDGKVEGDTIQANIRRLTATERSGFALTSLSTEARVTVNDITLDKLLIQTPNSEIRNHLSFRYQNFNDFGDFLNKVRIKAKLDGTEFSLKDLNYFLHTLDAVEHNRFYVNGEIDGRVNNLKGRGIEVRTGKNTFFSGDFYTRGLPDIYETSLNLRVNRLATNTNDIHRVYPGMKIPPNLANLGLIYFTGSLDGFLTDFVSTGRFVTGIGSARTDVNFKYDPKRNKARYTGELALNEFDLGKFFNDDKNLGKISLNGHVVGEGLTIESLKDSIDGNISSIVFRGHEYRDIVVSGLVYHRSFNGMLKVRDEFLDMDFKGTAVLSDTLPRYNFDAILRKAVLKSLNLTKANISLSGELHANIEGSNLDNINGELKLNQVKLSRDEVDAEVKYFSLKATSFDNNKKEIILNADFAEAEIAGTFSFRELPRALNGFVNSIFTRKYENIPDDLPVQNFTADIRIFEPKDLTQIFSPSFQKIKRSRVSAEFNSKTNYLKTDAAISEMQWDQYRIKDLSLTANSQSGSFDFNTSAVKIYSGDSVLLDTLNIRAKSEGEDIICGLLVRDRRNYNYADVMATVTPYSQGANIRMSPSDIKLGNYNWRFNNNNNINVRGNKITTNNLIFRTEEQVVYINSYLKNDTSTSLKITLDNTDVGDFTGIFTTKMKDLKGAINGKLAIEDVFYKPLVYADLVIDDFTLGNELVGDVNFDMQLDSSAKKIWIFTSVKSINNNIEAKGHVSIDPENPELNIQLNAPRIGLNFLNYKFFDKYVTNCKGYVTAKAHLKGTPGNPLLTGSALLVDDTVTVSYLNTTYRVRNQRAILDEKGFNLNGITVYDMKGAPIFANGRINHQSFRDFALDLKVRTENAQFLNTTAKQSPDFYGVAYGTGTITFSGPVNDPVITADAETGPNTHCKLPINSAFETNRYTFYRFDDKKKSILLQTPAKKPKLNGLDFTLNLTATPDARLDIILDPAAGDMLTTYGSGSLKIKIPKTGSTAIYGDYEISRGSYLFTLQSVINKRFEINSGGTIRFSGDVYKAGLNLNAVYGVRSSVADLIDDLINNDEQLTKIAQGRIPVKLLLNLSGLLEQPNIAFDIQTIDAEIAIRGYIEQKLMILKNNVAEMNKQVFGLLVMNKFLPSSASAISLMGSPTVLGGAAANTVSEFLSSQLSNYLGDLLTYTGNSDLSNLNINVNYRQYDPNVATAGAAPDTRRELQLALSQRLLNNRLSINAGGNLDFGNTPNGVERNVIPTGDFQIEYALTADGRWKAKAYNRTNYDFFNSRNSNRTGIGISYRREFDNPVDLFMRKSKSRITPTPIQKNDTIIPLMPDSIRP